MTLAQTMNYYAQSESAVRLTALEQRVMRLHPEYVAGLRLGAIIRGRDFYTYVASRVLDIDYHDVMECERIAVKHGLFFRSYACSMEQVFRR